MSYAFRCRNCNSLEPAGLAGERDVPIKCPTCGAGVKWEINEGGDPVKTEHPENWIVLADLDADGLKEVTDYHGEIDIERHEPFYSVMDDAKRHVLNDDGSIMTALVGSTPSVGRAPDPNHIPVLIGVEAVEATGSEDNA